MKVFKLMAVVALFSMACNSGSGQNILTVDQFEKKLNAEPDGQLIDVRTAEEYKSGHLANAQNINIDGPAFIAEISKLDKSKPVFVYCLAGGRSANAAGQLVKMGFKEVYDMKGGFRAWSGAGKPVDTGNSTAKPKSAVGMTKADLDKLLAEKPFSIVDFSAKWCGPCKKMSPVLDSLTNEMGSKVNIIKIDIDENPLVADAYAVESLPTLFYFTNTKVIGKSLGWYGSPKLRAEVKSYAKLAGVE